MTPTPGFHAYPGFYITERVFGYTPDCQVKRLKRKGPPRQMIYNLTRDYIRPLKYIVTWTQKLLPLYRLTGCLAYNPIGKTWRLSLLGHIPNSLEFLVHLTPEVRTGPYDSDQAWCTVFLPWPRPLVHLLGRPISSIIESAAELLGLASQAPPYSLEGRRMATRPWQRSALIAELARTFGTALAADRLEIRTFPLRDSQSAYLQT